jgi:DNA-binding Lrp family transcriptional regulator
MVHAYILAETKPGQAVRVSRMVAEVRGVRSAEITTGPWDVIAELEAESVGDLGKVVLTRIHAVEGVTRTLTCHTGV